MHVLSDTAIIRMQGTELSVDTNLGDSYSDQTGEWKTLFRMLSSSERARIQTDLVHTCTRMCATDWAIVQDRSNHSNCECL